MRSCRHNACTLPALLGADGQRGLGRLRERQGSLSVACLLLSLLLLVPAVSRHRTHSGDGAFEPRLEQTALLMFLPERLMLEPTDTRDIETACLWPAAAWTARAPLLPTALAITASVPPPWSMPSFPLRV